MQYSDLGVGEYEDLSEYPTDVIFEAISLGIANRSEDTLVGEDKVLIDSLVEVIENRVLTDHGIDGMIDGFSEMSPDDKEVLITYDIFEAMVR